MNIDKKTDATISSCGVYRYRLYRSLDSDLRWYRPAVFVMLNPSTADEIENDPTIRRCIDFAKREGRTHMIVINLFALRSTDPKALKYHADPVGPDNLIHWEKELKNSDFKIAAWGTNPMAKEQAKKIIEMYPGFLCLGKNKDGSPKHPLYLAKNTPLIEFD